MHSDLEAVLSQLEVTRVRGAELMDTLSPDQLNWRIAPGSWSIAECLDHLSVTADLYHGSITDALNTAPPLSGDRPFRYGWLESYFVRSLEPPVKRRFKAPGTFLPAADLDAARVRAHWEASHDRLFNLIRKCDGVALDRTKVRSPAIRFFKMSLGASLRSIAAHERRHIWQAEQVKQHSGFPGTIREATLRS
jgi:hypothetical protein